MTQITGEWYDLAAIVVPICVAWVIVTYIKCKFGKEIK